MRKTFLIIIFSAILILNNCSAKNKYGYIEGKVFKNSEPYKGKIEITLNNKKTDKNHTYKIKTKSDGSYKIKSKPGEYYLYISHFPLWPSFIQRIYKRREVSIKENETFPLGDFDFVKSIEILKPEYDTQIDIKDLTFEWKDFIGSDFYFLEIYNDNSELFLVVTNIRKTSFNYKDLDQLEVIEKKSVDYISSLYKKDNSFILKKKKLEKGSYYLKISGYKNSENINNHKLITANSDDLSYFFYIK